MSLRTTVQVECFIFIFIFMFTHSVSCSRTVCVCAGNTGIDLCQKAVVAHVVRG